MQKLQKEYPNEKLTGFFYDPNIHPYSEYRLRYLDVERSCKKLGMELLEGEYDFEDWIKRVRGLESEPEKGERCAVCFDRRFEVSAHKALELGEKSFTTTLLVSPLKSQEQLKKSGEMFEKEHGVKFIAPDYRSGGGTQDQARVTKEEQLYRQDYCGCIYGLTMQREQQERLMDEMFSPINNQVLPASIEERLAFYKERMELEEQNREYRIFKEKFLNYRQFFCTLKEKEKVIPAYALFYSLLPRKRASGKIEFEHEGVGYFNRDEIIFITLDRLNFTCQSHYKNVMELIFNPPSIEAQMRLRATINPNPFNLSPLIVVDEFSHAKLDIYLDATTYEDTKERLLLL